MTVQIPRTRIRTVTLRPRLFSGEQESPLGGPDLRVPRMGDRWIAEIATAQLRFDEPGRALVAALTRGLTEDGTLSIGQPNLPAPLATGNGVTDGAGFGGTTLRLRAVSPSADVPTGTYLSVIHGGRRYVHMTTAAATTSVTGKVDLQIWPMMRFLTIDGETVELLDPKIEGRVSGFGGATWVRNRIDPLAFTIAERQ